MSEVKVNKISPRTNCGTVQLGDSGDTITIPAGATITNSGTAAGFGATGAASWDTTVKTTGFTAVDGVGYFVNTTAGAITVTLPLSPAAGAVVAVKDYANTFDTNAVTLGRNGSNIGGAATDATLSIEGLAITLVYVDATKGWLVTDNGDQTTQSPKYVTATGGTITTCGDYKIHTFTGPGTLCVSNAGNPLGSDSVDYLVVAGGGTGGSPNFSGYESGGGGAGGLRIASSFPISVTAFPIIVGAGGAGSPTGNNGSNSSFSTIISAGGGSGAGAPGLPALTGAAGGSGGGGGQGACGIAGTGNTPPVSPPQGNPGGNGGTPGLAGGGGGSGTAGSTSGVGGSGTDVTPTFGAAPQPFYQADNPDNGPSAGGIFAGGGGGATPGKAGGPGGGANGSTNATAYAGTANTGGGGGGITTPAPACTPGGSGGSGGSGIVIIRYKFQN
jgi:hypothetical protein